MSQLNRTWQTERQPGSTIKPVTYLTALQKGLQPNTLVRDEPMTLPPIGGARRSTTRQEYSWTPRNADHRSLGTLTLRRRLEYSRNLVTAHLLGGIETDPAKSLDDVCAWRALFFIGILPALLVFYIRVRVPEPAIFHEAAQSRAQRSTLEIFRKLLPTTILGAALSTGAQGGYYAITTFLPTFLRNERHLTVLGTGGYLAVIIIGSWFGYIVSAYLSDGIGRRKNFFIFAVGSLLIAIAYTQTEISDSLMLALGFPLGFFASGIFSGLGPVLTELFPTSVRGAGQGFCYNFGRGIGAFFPTLVGFLSARVALGIAIGIFAAISYAIVILAALALPETRGRELKAN